jgi:aminopeptidase N
MLRGILGDGPFLQTHKYFLTRHAYEAVGTEDFISAVKNATGRNMDWFFDQWLYKPGHPIIEANHVVSADGSTISLTLKQKQNFDEGVPVFRMPVTVELTDRDGRRREEVWLEEIQQTFEFLVRGSAPTIVVDPNRELLMELQHTKTQTELRAQLTSPSMGSRLEAVSNLAPDDPASRTALAATMNGDTFWKIREAATTQLAVQDDKEAAGWFTRVMRTDQDSRVRAAAVRGLGVSGSARNADSLLEIWTNDPSYRVQAAILQALGQIGRKSDEAFVRSALEMKSPRNVLANAATRALERFGEE